jgi:tripartite-type tricarboxylate transporter receptor subunit TctC
MDREIKQGIRRIVLLACLGMACGPLAASAQVYPDRPVRFIVTSVPGGGPDIVIRMVADRLTKLWGVPAIVENRPGGTGTIATQAVVRSAPDGYTALFTVVTLIQAPVLLPKVPYDLERDFVPVTLVTQAPVILAVKADSPFRTLPELLSKARTASSPVSYGTIGNGTSHHIYGETLTRAAKANLLHVPYKGETPALADLLGGQIDSAFTSIGAALRMLNAGKIRALAVIGSKRSAVLPGVPTFPELGFGALTPVGWFGVLVPSGTPREIVRKLSIDISRTVQQADVAGALREMGFEPVGNTPEEYAEFLRSEYVKWEGMIRNAGIKVAQ